MNIIVTGCKGQLGIELSRQIEKMGNDFNVFGIDVHNLDITNYKAVKELVIDKKPDVILNCAAYTNVDECESNEELAFRVNAIGARNMSAAAYSIGAKIIQVSTDYVFDGFEDKPKREYDPVNPQSCYGKSKALGERLVIETNPRHFIVRTAWLYGEGKNFIRTMLGLYTQKNELSVVGDQFGSPTSTVDLASCILRLAGTDSFGTYHATCEGECSWYDFAVKIFELEGKDIKINKITTAQLNRPAKRPQYSVLENYMLKLEGMNSFRHWEDALKEYLKADTNH